MLGFVRFKCWVLLGCDLGLLRICAVCNHRFW